MTGRHDRYNGLLESVGLGAETHAHGRRTLADYVLRGGAEWHHFWVTLGVILAAILARLAMQPLISPYPLPFISAWTAAIAVTILCDWRHALVTMLVMTTFGVLLNFGGELDRGEVVNTIAHLAFSSFNIWMVHSLWRRMVNSDLVAKELNHRNKNHFAVVQAIAAQSLQGEDRDRFVGRIAAMSRADSRLIDSGGEVAPVESVIKDALVPFSLHRFTVDVRPAGVTCASRACKFLGLIVHELATNATKHGALRPECHGCIVHVAVNCDDGFFNLFWRECKVTGLSPMGAPGSGHRIIDRMARHSGGAAKIELLDDGLRCRVRVPLSLLQERG